jgi:hypothetical protein
MPGPEEQIVISDASIAEIHAMSAKVGEAARPSQLVASWVCRARASLFFAGIDAVIFYFPIELDRFRPLSN